MFWNHSPMLNVSSQAPSATPDYTGKRGFDELLSDRRGLLDRPHYEEQVGRIVAAMVRAVPCDPLSPRCPRGRLSPG